MPDIDDLRKRIDAIDEELVRLLNERAAAAFDIGDLKGSGSVYVPAREKAVYEHLFRLNTGPLPNHALQSIFREIMSATISLQRKTSVAYFGKEGTFTHQAALRQFGRSIHYVPCAGIEDVFDSVEKALADYGVVPVENSTEGGVNLTLDMFISSSPRICSEIYLPIHHHLMAARSDIDLSSVSRVYSHPQALAQCRRFLGSELHHAELVPVASTVDAAIRVREEPRSCAVAGEVAAEIYGLSIVRRNIEDNPRNITRFLVIARESGPPSGNDKTSVALSIKDEVGALHHILEPFESAGVNLTRIESRPGRRRTWDYVFFIDLEGHADDPPVRKVLDAVKSSCAYLDVLGSYPRADSMPVPEADRPPA
ncbi:MAG: prephenate dehydratase [Planctomycetes bacterium]|nr:prephenate dehydratase [Planctomycetota bacterium]